MLATFLHVAASEPTFLIIGGMILFGDKVSLVQAGFMAMIVIGVAGTKLFGQG